MRIIAGEYRRRKLVSPKGFETRPIPDRVKESVFGMLGVRVEGASVVDLFAGTGSVGLEALSRGARQCMFVEQDREAAAVLERNIALLGCEGKCKVVKGDALGLSVAARCPRPVDLVFFDPPYALVRERLGWERVKGQMAALGALLAADGFLVMRSPWPFELEAAAETDGVAEVGEPKRTAGKSGKWDAKKKAKKERFRFKDEDGEMMEEMDAEEVEKEAEGEGDPVEEQVEGVEGPAPAVGPKALADMVVAGCKGPETHVYGTTAVHWYMKA